MAKHLKLSELNKEEAKFITPGLTTDSRGRPTVSGIPSLDNMKDLTTSGLAQVLKNYNVFGPWGTFIAESRAYVSRMTTYAPGSKAFDKAAEQLVDSTSKRGLLGMARRASENWSTLEAIKGNENQELMWVCLDSDSSCENCLEKDGQIYTYLEWQVIGPPGAATCLGGNYCRCSLIRVD